MDNPLADVKIFKINIGPDPINGMSYNVGQRIQVGKGKDKAPCEISRIVRSENNFHFFGNLAYIIYAERMDNGKEFVFKYFENMPVYVTGVTPGTSGERLVDKQFQSIHEFKNENTP